MFTTRPELQGTFGMVTSTHWLASAAGMAMLERGGNAFDAAVAAGFALQVVEPHLNGPGGEVPVIFSRGGGEPTVLCGQGPAPAAATAEAFSGMDHIPGAGLVAACVPGAVDAWLLLLRDHGTLALRDVLDHAIQYAQHGFPVLERIEATVRTVEDVFRSHWPTSAALWLADGPPRTGTLFRNRALAETYVRLLKESEQAGGDREVQIEAARRVWREGFVAEAVLELSRVPHRDSSGEDHPGLLTADDMATWSATYEDPVTVDHHGWTVCKTGAWGQGPVFLQQLQLLDVLGIADVDVHSADFVHLTVEAAKLAFADREAWYGDPEFVDVPLTTLISRDYAQERARLVGSHASLELRPGSPAGRTPRLPAPATQAASPGAAAAAAGIGEPTVARAGTVRGDTCHVDAVDRWGNIVSATPSGGWLQSSPTVPSLGFPLGTRAQMFWLDTESPSGLAPRKRPRTTLTPTLVLRDGEPVLALGTPGGDQQDQWSLTYFLRLVHGGLDLQAGIDAPMFHTNSFPSSFYPRQSAPGEVVIELRFGDGVVADLERRGHRVTVSEAWSLGRLSAVRRDPSSGIMRAGANPRGMQGYAVGR